MKNISVNQNTLTHYKIKENVLREEISYEQVFPTRPGYFYLDKWGTYCDAHVEGSKVIMVFSCDHITGGYIMAKLTSQMLGTEVTACRQALAGPLVVTIDMAQFKDLDKPVRLNYKNEYVRIGGLK